MAYTDGPWMAIKQKGGDSRGSYEIARASDKGNAVGLTFIHIIGPQELLHPMFMDNINDNAELVAAAPELVEVLEEIINCPYTLDEATIPKAGTAANPEQVVGMLSVGLVRILKARDLIARVKGN